MVEQGGGRRRELALQRFLVVGVEARKGRHRPGEAPAVARAGRRRWGVDAPRQVDHLARDGIVAASQTVAEPAPRMAPGKAVQEAAAEVERPARPSKSANHPRHLARRCQLLKAAAEPPQPPSQGLVAIGEQRPGAQGPVEGGGEEGVVGRDKAGPAGKPAGVAAVDGAPHRLGVAAGQSRRVELLAGGARRDHRAREGQPHEGGGAGEVRAGEVDANPGGRAADGEAVVHQPRGLLGAADADQLGAEAGQLRAGEPRGKRRQGAEVFEELVVVAAPLLACRFQRQDVAEGQGVAVGVEEAARVEARGAAAEDRVAQEDLVRRPLVRGEVEARLNLRGRELEDRLHPLGEVRSLDLLVPLATDQVGGVALGEKDHRAVDRALVGHHPDDPSPLAQQGGGVAPGQEGGAESLGPFGEEAVEEGTLDRDAMGEEVRAFGRQAGEANAIGDQQAAAEERALHRRVGQEVGAEAIVRHQVLAEVDRPGPVLRARVAPPLDHHHRHPRPRQGRRRRHPRRSRPDDYHLGRQRHGQAPPEGRGIPPRGVHWGASVSHRSFLSNAQWGGLDGLTPTARQPKERTVPPVAAAGETDVAGDSTPSPSGAARRAERNAQQHPRGGGGGDRRIAGGPAGAGGAGGERGAARGSPPAPAQRGARGCGGTAHPRPLRLNGPVKRANQHAVASPFVPLRSETPRPLGRAVPSPGRFYDLPAGRRWGGHEMRGSQGG